MTAATAAHERTSTPRGPRPARRTLRSDLEALRVLLGSAVAAQPIAATGAAAGIGFLVGGGMTRRTIILLFETGTRFAASWLREAIRRIALENLSTAAEERRGATKGPETRTGGRRS